MYVALNIETNWSEYYNWHKVKGGKAKGYLTGNPVALSNLELEN